MFLQLSDVDRAVFRMNDNAPAGKIVKKLSDRNHLDVTQGGRASHLAVNCIIGGGGNEIKCFLFIITRRIRNYRRRPGITHGVIYNNDV